MAYRQRRTRPHAAPAAPPRDFATLRVLIQARHAALPRRLAQVAAHALRNPDDFAFGTVASIATGSGVQPSTLVRFAQALGYLGFTDLQQVFRARLRERRPSYEARLQALRAHADPAAAAGRLFAGFTEAAARSLASMRDSLDLRTIERAIEVLAGAGTIYLAGQRRSYPVVAYLGYGLGKLGVRNVLLGSAAGTDPETMSFAGPADALLAVSVAPYAPATLALVADAVARGVPVVALSDGLSSPLAATAVVMIEIVEADFEGFRSSAAAFTVAMTLAVAVAERRAAGPSK